MLCVHSWTVADRLVLSLKLPKTPVPVEIDFRNWLQRYNFTKSDLMSTKPEKKHVRRQKKKNTARCYLNIRCVSAPWELSTDWTLNASWMACQSLPVADWFPQHSSSVARQQWFTGACILTGWLLRVAYLKSCWTHESWEETYVCVTELLWCHWGGVWLQASHHRRSGLSHRRYHGKCGCAKI